MDCQYYLKKCKSGTVSHTFKEWHSIMGHCNRNYLLKLESVVKKMKITGDITGFDCEVCLKAKMTQTRCRKADKRASSALDFVHVYLTGPIEPSSNESFRFILGCMDDYTGIVIPYLIKQQK